MTNDPTKAGAEGLSNRGGYTPAPVNKTRTVTGGSIPKLTDQPNEGNYKHLSDLGTPAPASRIEEDRSKPSIQINLATIDQTTQHVIEKEQEETDKLAEFSPLSATPVMYQSATADEFIPRSENGSFESIPAALTPFAEAPATSSKMPDLYKSRRRSMRLVIFCFLLGAWFIGMATQVGITRLISNPYKETMTLIYGQQIDSAELDKLREPGIQTTVVIEEGRAIANILSVQPLTKNIVMVQGVVINESSKSLDTVLLSLSLSSPEGSRNSWSQKFEFSCCEYRDYSTLSPKELNELLDQRSKMPQDASVIRLREGEDKKFTFLAQLKSKNSIKKGKLPQTELKVTFFE